jgi:hypothetical protein
MHVTDVPAQTSAPAEMVVVATLGAAKVGHFAQTPRPADQTARRVCGTRQTG